MLLAPMLYCWESKSQRLNSLVQAEVIRQVAPDLLQYPINPRDLEFGVLREIASKSTDAPLYFYKVLAGKKQRMLRA